MNNARSLVIFSILTLLSLCCQAQTLWRETVVGMSPDEVRKLVPEAEPPAGKAGVLADGAVEILRVSQFELLGERFAASFYFKDEKLAQVTLALQGEKSFPAALSTFDSLSEALRTKYGSEISRRVSQTPFPSANATWLSGRTNISATVFSVARGHLVFNVNYQVRVAREADKL